MITLILVTGFIVASCLAAVGLIASTLKGEGKAGAMSGLEVSRDLGA